MTTRYDKPGLQAPRATCNFAAGACANLFAILEFINFSHRNLQMKPVIGGQIKEIARLSYDDSGHVVVSGLYSFSFALTCPTFSAILK